LMEALHTFAWGRESRYRFTEAGWNFASALRAPSPAEYAAPRR
jgi:hypothetical protein